MAPILQGAACFQIGSGSQVCVWTDPWLPYPAPHCPVPRINSIALDEEFKVDSLLLPFSRSWNASLVRDLFSAEDAAIILNIPVPRSHQDDKLIWTADCNGEFSLKSVHTLINAHSFQSSLLTAEEWKSLWRIPMLDRLKLFLWKVAWNCLPSMDNVERLSHNSVEDNLCSLLPSFGFPQPYFL